MQRKYMGKDCGQKPVGEKIMEKKTGKAARKW